MINKYRRILCGSLLLTTGIFILYNYGRKTTGFYVTGSFVSRSRSDIAVGNLSKLSTKTTFIRIKETFFKMYKKYRRQKKQMSGQGVSLLETTQQLRLPCPLDLFLLILVPSRANAILNRIAMRLSWAHNFKPSKERKVISNFMYQVVFVIKEHSEDGILVKESKKFGDVLIVSHRSLTILPAIDRLLSRKCEPKFLLVLDDDNTFVNVPELASWLLKLNSTVRYTGNIGKSMAVATKSLSSTPNNIQNSIPCCAGGAYVLAGKILKEIVGARRDVPLSTQDTNEAMYVSTLTSFLGIEPYRDNRFKSRQFEDLNISDINPCTLKQEVFIHHVFRVRHILLYTKMIVVGEQPCAGI